MIRRHGESQERRDGARSDDGRVAATYLHGLFDNDAFRHAFLRAQRVAAGLGPAAAFADVRAQRELRIDRLADLLAEPLDLEVLLPDLAVV